MYDIWQFMKVRCESSLSFFFSFEDIFIHAHTTKHYYHWWGEIILGGWRVYSLLGFDSDGNFHPEWLQSPDRFLIPVRNTWLFAMKCRYTDLDYTLRWWMIGSGGMGLDSSELLCGQLFLRQQFRRETNGGI